MSTINLYKIDSQKYDDFIQELGSKYKKISISKKFINDFCEENEEIFYFYLYIANPQGSKKISWDWAVELFDSKIDEVTSNPKAVLLVEYESNDKEVCYALTFGSSFFAVDKYCDSDFGFDFARKVKFKEIKTTTSTTPNLRRNKTINSYIDYVIFDFDSGESFAKIKGNIELFKNFKLFNPSFEIGNSIKFSIRNNSFEYIALSILYIEHIINSKSDINNIPVFSKIKDKDTISKLDESLKNSIQEGNTICISEVDIVGAWEVFNRNDDSILIRYRDHEKEIDELNEQELRKFCEELDLPYQEDILNARVTIFQNGNSVATKFVKELIDYTNDENKSILIKGTWYSYNDDYIEYLEYSMNEIEVNYEEKYDFTRDRYDQFLEEQFQKNATNTEYSSLSDKEIRERIKSKYYAERAFNMILEDKYQFVSYDRKPRNINGYIVEPMDLYKDKTMWAVKMGESSSKLCYAVDQSLSSFQLYKRKAFNYMPKIDKVGIWLVLDRTTPIKKKNGHPDLNELKMLMLKNKIDNWKKEVRLAGLIPVININYRTS